MSLNITKRLKNIWSNYKDEFAWLLILLVLLIFPLFSVWNISPWATNLIQDNNLVSIGIIILIDAYLFFILLVSSFRSSARYKEFGDKFQKAFPSRPMGFALLIAFMVANSVLFSNLYFSHRRGFCNSKDIPMQTKSEAFYFSFGIMTSASIVDFNAETDCAKGIKASHIASNIILLLGAFSFLVSRISTFDEIRKKTKLLSFNKKIPQTQFCNDNVKKLTGLSLEDWCAFTGIFSDPIPEIPVTYSDFKIEGNYPELKLTLNKDDNDLQFEFNINDKKITILSYKLEKRSSLTIARLFNHFLNEAIRLKFKSIEYTGTVNYKDFKLWQSFGFLIDDPAGSLEKVKSYIRDGEEIPSSLDAFLVNEAIYEIWTKKNPMLLKFDTSSTSKSIFAWKAFLTSVQAGQQTDNLIYI